MTKLEAMALSEGLTRLVVGMETDLMKNIADFLAAGQAETSTALWKIKKLAELGALNKKNKRTIAEYAEIQPEMQQITLEAAAVKAINQLEPGFRELVKEGVLKDAEEMPMADTMMRAVKMLGKQAASDLNIVNTTMLYKAKKAAEKVINDTAELANKQDFLDSLNKAAGKVVTGIESRQAAMRKCIGEMTEKGIPAFTDKLGREWTPEAYTNMCIRTTVAKTATETQMERMDDYGVNLVAVSSHIGARPLCAPYQGRIFDRNNGSGYTTDLNDKKIRYEAWNSTSYGKPAGLLGINCGHQIYPFIPGINVQRYFPYDDKENAEQYKKLQKQRQLEREVRAAKRECTALDTVGDKAGFDEAAVRLKEKQQKLKDYCSSNGLTYKPDRTATPGYGKSEAAKVTASYKKSVELEKAQITFRDIDNSTKNDIIKSETISSVPLAKIGGFSESENLKLQQMHKKILEDISEKEVDTEELIYCDEKMNFLDNAFGNDSSVSLPAPKEKYIAMHNHPSSNTFSHNDIFRFSENTNMFAITVIGNNGKNLFVLEKTSDYQEVNFAMACSDLNEDMNNIIKDKSKTIDDAYKLLEDFLKGAEKYGVKYTAIQN